MDCEPKKRLDIKTGPNGGHLMPKKGDSYLPYIRCIDLIRAIRGRRVCSNSCNDVPRVAQRYGTIAVEDDYKTFLNMSLSQADR